MDAKVAARDAEAARLAARQHGVATAAQLLEIGFSRRLIAARAKAGLLHRLHQGVYAVGHPGLSQEGDWMAAVLACCGYRGVEPGDAFLSHRSAAALWGMLPLRTGPIDVAIVGEAGRARHQGIRIHRPRTLEESMTATVHGIPTTDPARTLDDLRRFKVSRGGATPGHVRKALRQASFLGLPLGRLNPDRTRSELEQKFLDLCRQFGLPAPEVNTAVAELTVDFFWPEPRLVVETDGYRFHGGEVEFHDDRRRDLRLRSLSCDVIHLSYEQVTKESDVVAAALRERLAAT